MVTIAIQNNGNAAVAMRYSESVYVNYEVPQQQRLSEDKRIIKFSNTLSYNGRSRIVKAAINATSDDPLLFTNRDSIMQIDGFPPCLFVKMAGKDGTLSVKENDEISADFDFILQPGEMQTFELIVGFSFNDDFDALNRMALNLLNAREPFPNEKNRFAKHWLQVLPSFSHEKDEIIRREMEWNAYVLESMATYSEYFQ